MKTTAAILTSVLLATVGAEAKPLKVFIREDGQRTAVIVELKQWR